MRAKFLLSPLVLAALLAAAGSAHADLTVYTSQSSFVAAISNVAVDNFSDLMPTSPYDPPLARTAGSYSYTANAGPVSGFYTAAQSGSDVWLSTDYANDTITFSGFSPGVQGIGGLFFGTDVNGEPTANPGSIVVMATDASGSVTETLVNPGPTSFLGFVTTSTIASLSIWAMPVGTCTDSDGSGCVWPTVSELTLGTVTAAVPEPETYALMCGGLALVGWAARRGRKR